RLRRPFPPPPRPPCLRIPRRTPTPASPSSDRSLPLLMHQLASHECFHDLSPKRPARERTVSRSRIETLWVDFPFTLRVDDGHVRGCSRTERSVSQAEAAGRPHGEPLHGA